MPDIVPISQGLLDSIRARMTKKAEDKAALREKLKAARAAKAASKSTAAPPLGSQFQQSLGSQCTEAVEPAVEPSETTVEPLKARFDELPASEPFKLNRPKYRAHDIDTPADLFLAHRPDMQIYRWQAEELFRLAGYVDLKPDGVKKRATDKIPLYYNLVAANGSGKDQVVICSFAVWFAMTKIRSRCVITSSSHEQLKDQTFKYIKNLCEIINHSYQRKVFEIVEFLITCNDTGSEIKCFVTDDPGKAEGRHPFDDPGAEMAVIINEAKSITDEMFTAFSRFTGYNYWLEISSPGTDSGHFFKRCTMAKHKYPDALVLGEYYWRRITAYDCPHLLGKHIEHLEAERGRDSLIFRSQVLAEFTSIDSSAYIPSGLFENYPKLVPNNFGLPNRAGIDLSLGGDETTGYFFINGRLILRAVKFRNEALLHNQIISWLKEFNILPENANVDDGGLGRPIIQRVQNAGFAINPIRNEARSNSPQFFRNRGVENWNRIKRMLEDKVLPVIEDDLTRLQLCTRGYEVIGIVTKLESKADMRARGVSSPDRADALALVFDGLPLSLFKSETSIALDSTERFQELVRAQSKRSLSKEEQMEFSALWSNLTKRSAQDTLNASEPREESKGYFHNELMNG
jgi:phage terminase large subunit